jgi:hypothetical protein
MPSVALRATPGGLRGDTRSARVHGACALQPRFATSLCGDSLEPGLTRPLYPLGAHCLHSRRPRNFPASKGLTGLDEHQVRRWTSWYRRVALAVPAAAFPAIAAALEHARSPDPDGQIPLTRNEIAHLLASTACPPGA